jgi:hypothetical protein
MIEVIISTNLAKEIKKIFGKTKSLEIADLFDTLKKNPHKGKLLICIGPFVLEELKYEQYRFYFVMEGHKLRLYTQGELKDLLIKFVRMSNKDTQQNTINEIKKALKLMKLEMD